MKGICDDYGLRNRIVEFDPKWNWNKPVYAEPTCPLCDWPFRPTIEYPKFCKECSTNGR